jgi:very-short-patch-repair endonuclease
MSQPEIKKKIIPSLLVGQKISAEKKLGTSCHATSERMKANNPMMNAESKEKMRLSLIGRKLIHRGGNGKITTQQAMIRDATGYVTEHSINTRDVRGLFQAIPNSYAVDLAIPDLKIAIEVDGKSHKREKWKLLDAKKELVLGALGWKVLRFWNEEVTDNLPMVLKTINECIALR